MSTKPTWTAARRVALAALACAGVTILTGLTATGALAAGCAVRASRAWSAADQPALTVEAIADGPSCAHAVVTIAVRADDGGVVWARAFVAAENLVLRDGSTAKKMQAALRRWIDPTDLRLASTGALPEWAPDADAPGGEFPFRPAETYAGREDYEALRAADRPLLCVVSGAEGILCAVYQDGRIDEVGTQSFPG